MVLEKKFKLFFLIYFFYTIIEIIRHGFFFLLINLKERLCQFFFFCECSV